MTEPGHQAPAPGEVHVPGSPTSRTPTNESMATLVARALTVHRPLIVSEAPPGTSNAAVLEGPRVAGPPNQAARFRKLVARGLAAAAGALCLVFLAVWALLRVELYFAGGAWAPVVGAWLTVEALFAAWMLWYHIPHFNKQPQPHKPAHNDPVLHFRRLVAHAHFLRDSCGQPVDWVSYLTQWFCDTDMSDIRIGNLQEMVAYGFFYSTKEELQMTGQWGEVVAMTDELLQLMGFLGDMPSPRPRPARATNTFHLWPGSPGRNTPGKEAERIAVSSRRAATSPVQPRPRPEVVAAEGAAPEPAAALASVGGGQGEGEGDQAPVLRPGYTPDLKYMAHLWEPLRVHHRPLFMYIGVEALHLVSRAWMWACGFQRGTHNGMTYYFRPSSRGGSQPVSAPGQSPSSHTAAAERPLVMLHGVGVGVLPYLLFISHLAASGAPLLCPEAAHVSLRLVTHVPTADEVADNVVGMMDKLGLGPACVVAHSYGTFVASRLAQVHCSRTIHSLALMDPVCFGMFLPALLRSFVYRTPVTAYHDAGGGWPGLVAALKASLIYLVSRDVHCSTTFCRKFYWTDVNLWAEDLPQRCLIVLAGADELMHAEEARLVLSGEYQGVPKGPAPMRMAMKVPTALVTATSPGQGAAGPQGGSPGPPPAPRIGSGPNGRRLLWNPAASHATFLLDPSWSAEIVEQVLVLAHGEPMQEYITRRRTTHMQQLQLHPAAGLHRRSKEHVARSSTDHHGWRRAQASAAGAGAPIDLQSAATHPPPTRRRATVVGAEQGSVDILAGAAPSSGQVSGPGPSEQPQQRADVSGKQGVASLLDSLAAGLSTPVQEGSEEGGNGEARAAARPQQQHQGHRAPNAHGLEEEESLDDVVAALKGMIPGGHT